MKTTTMKSKLFGSVGIAAIFSTASVHSESADSKIESINSRIAEAQRKSASTVSVHTQKVEEKIEVAVSNDSLFGRSSFLTDGRLTVIVPKGAVVSLAGQDRLSEGSRIVGKLVEWDEFLRANRAVMELIDIPGDKLHKPEPINESIMEKIQENKLVGVTTYQARPVAVKLPPEPSPEIVKP